MHKLVQEKISQQDFFNGNDLIERQITSRLVCSTCKQVVKDRIIHATIGVNSDFIRAMEIEHNFDYLYTQIEYLKIDERFHL